MSKVIVANYTVSLDGYGAGPNQRLDQPFGDDAEVLHDWMLIAMAARDRGETGPGVDQLDRFRDGVGATIMGRNMFSPLRGAWADESWRGYWGENPPYHHATFVHTHHLRPDLVMDGGTTFHFTDQPAAAVLDRAREAAGDQDIVVAGGAATIRQYLDADLIDEIDLMVAPIFLGAGESPFGGDALKKFDVTDTVVLPRATLYRLRR
ncbi:dihydrofolate reductase [Kribbella sandramycini]|uniref:Dihydrofolate reductase n=1 Tax=Kribbella sandramycini TaxID=60450 RepID=A0A7Y4L6M4_9ACTN|nr:dihydrofolate reductase family protein [Kribbella sandramycini]MBB6571739.1 dihydrofolate reductase [Kribbella sandramycini]NOL44382.1 dihydrofolate reductase [Kribbella sandramycini]